MPTYTLVLLDTVGIQDYVFGSNTLRENVGASELVWRATSLWPLQAVAELGPSNVRPAPRGRPDDLDDELHIERDGLAAEVIYSGGGNCAILFADPTAPKRLIGTLSRRMLEEAPGLNWVTTCLDVDWEHTALAEKVRAGVEQLAIRKLDRHGSLPMLGLAVTLPCRSTGLPAVGDDREGRPLSADVLAKIRAVPLAKARLGDSLASLTGKGLDIPLQLDDLGRTWGDTSYVAVVHADANALTERIRRLGDDYCSAKVNPDYTFATLNRRYIGAMRGFSRAVLAGAQQALGELGGLLARHLDDKNDAIEGWARHPLEDRLVRLGRIELAICEGERHYAPFRPLIFGGDDLTFVADGRLGLTLAASYLGLYERALAGQNNPYLQGVTACAGVSVVKVHYPFARAYALAEDLCGNAKTEWARQCSALDWHLAPSGLIGDIALIRKRQYTVDAGYLQMRSLPLEEGSDAWRSWPAFVHAVKTFLLADAWSDKRNKVLALQQSLRAGPQAVEQFLKAYEPGPLPVLNSGIAALQDSGWDGDRRCGYFDAAEAMEFYLPLEK
jgi:hypothetical protein